MQNLATYAHDATDKAYQYAQQNPYKALACTSFIVGTTVATLLTVKKSAELGQSIFNSCSCYENYHSTCDWLGFTQPENPVSLSSLSKLPFMLFPA